MKRRITLWDASAACTGPCSIRLLRVTGEPPCCVRVWFNVARDPSAGLATWLSFYPPGTPFIMTVRMATPTGVPWWQPPASVAVLVVAALGCVLAAGRIVRIGVLSQGNTPKLRELVRWAVTG